MSGRQQDHQDVSAFTPRQLGSAVSIVVGHPQISSLDNGRSVPSNRPEERFAYLVHEGVRLMLEEAAGPGRRFHTAPLQRPFSRGMNLQIRVTDVDALYASVQRPGLSVVIPLEERWYRQDQAEAGNRQFVMADPDGYLLRFFRDLGRRPAKGATA